MDEEEERKKCMEEGELSWIGYYPIQLRCYEDSWKDRQLPCPPATQGGEWTKDGEGGAGGEGAAVEAPW